MFTTPPQSEYQSFIKINKHLDYFACNQQAYDQLVHDINNYSPNNIFEFFGKQLLLTVLLPSRNNQYTYAIPNHQLGFEYQRNYAGLMATKKVEKGKTKRGLFDFKIKVDSSTNKTHYMVFSDLLAHSSLPSCVNVWTGIYSPLSLTTNANERFALEELILMMFEQEVNWGDEVFQAFSAFSRSKSAKPRDVLMGFTNIVFTNKKVDAIPNWQGNKTPDFGGAYANYDVTLKNTYFQPYRSNGGALMQGAVRDLFFRTSQFFVNNPIYK